MKILAVDYGASRTGLAMGESIEKAEPHQYVFCFRAK